MTQNTQKCNQQPRLECLNKSTRTIHIVPRNIKTVHYHFIFHISLTVHLGIIRVNNQLDALFSMYLFIYFTSLHVSSNPVLIITRINCINTSSGIHHSVYVTAWYAGLLNGIPTQSGQDDVLIQLILLMMSTGLLETCRKVK